MRWLLAMALLAIGCGSIEPDPADLMKNPVGTCPDVNAPNFDGYSCDGDSTPMDGHPWICGVVDTSKPAVWNAKLNVSVPAFMKRDTGCWVADVTMTTHADCVAKCP
jgi:hypothetical protein